MQHRSFDEAVTASLDEADIIVLLANLPSNGGEPSKIIFINQAFRRKTGYKNGELIGAPIEMLQLKFADGQPIEPRHFSTRTAQREATLCAKNGQIIRLDVQLGKGIDPQERTPYLSLIARNDSGTKPPEAEHLTQQLLASVFMSAGTAIAVLDLEGQFVAVNPEFTQLLRYGQQDVAGRTVWDLMAPDERAALSRKHGGAFRDGTRFGFSATFRRLDGTQIPLDVTITVSALAKLQRFRILTLAEQSLRSFVNPGGGPVAPPTSLAKGVKVVAGQIRLIGLDEVRASLGARWPAVADRVMVAAERIVAAGMEPGDDFRRTDDNGFLIRFADGAEDRASLRAAGISREIRERLIGPEPELAGCAVTAITRSVDVPAASAVEGRESVLGLLEQRLSAQRAEIEREARADLAAAFANGRMEREDLYDLRGQPIPVALASLPRDWANRVAVAAASLSPADLVDFELDLAALRLTLAAEAALGDIQQNRKGAYLVPIEFRLFEVRRHVEGFLKLCRPLQRAVRQRVMFILCGIPRSVAQSRLHEVVNLLVPFSLGVGFEVASLTNLPGDLSQFKIPLILINAATLLDTRARSPDQVEKFVRRIQLSGSRLVARALADRGDLPALAELGAHAFTYAPGVARTPPPGASPEERLPDVVPERATTPFARLEAAIYAAAINSLTAGIIVTDATAPDNPIIQCNPAFTAITGHRQDDIIGQNCRLLQGPRTDRATVAELRDAIAQGVPIRREILNYRKDGTPIWIDLAISPVRDTGGRVIAHIGIQTDITQRYRAEESDRNARRLLQNVSTTLPGYIFQRILHADGSFRIPFISQSLARLVGAPEGQKADERLLLQCIHPADLDMMKAEIRRVAKDLTPLTLEYRLIAFDGSIVWMRTQSQPVRQADGTIVWNGVAIDVTAEKSTQERLSQAVTRDPVTGLPNRIEFQARLSEAIRQAKARDQILGLIYLDLCDFSALNDAMGAEVGDIILKTVADRLPSRDGRNLLARIGGDEFAIGIPDVGSADNLIDQARAIGMAIASPIEINDKRFAVRVYTGVATFGDPPHRGVGEAAPAVSTDPGRDLMKAADIALSTAKLTGSGSILLYSSEFDDRIRNKVILEQELHKALEARQFDLHFQPLVSLQSGQIVGAEALIRWRHPTLGIQRPDQFIPIAEATGQIVPLGAWVVEEGLNRLRRWSAIMAEPPRLAINVSGVQLNDPGFFDHVTGRLAASGVDPRRLELELTETAIVNVSAEITACLQALRRRGVTIAIDDFGTGYSSFRYLRDLPIDKVKIDQSFIRQMVVNSSDAAIVRGIIAIARDLGLQVVVEGIETPEQFAFLKAEGCTVGQGYLFSLPLVEEDFLWMIANKLRLPLNAAAPQTPDPQPTP